MKSMPILFDSKTPNCFKEFVPAMPIFPIFSYINSTLSLSVFSFVIETLAFTIYGTYICLSPMLYVYVVLGEEKVILIFTIHVPNISIV